MVALVISSGVGPRPPVTAITSARLDATFRAFSISFSVSEMVVTQCTSNPTDLNFCDIHVALELTVG